MVSALILGETISFCPNCCDEAPILLLSGLEGFDFGDNKDRMVAVITRYRVCRVCGEDFWTGEDGSDEIAWAMDIHRMIWGKDDY